ncbi:MAG: hypothetical protein RL477_56, partial [Pseudomonadota bacterium]
MKRRRDSAMNGERDSAMTGAADSARGFGRAALDALLRPRSIAVVGASDRANVGGRIFRNVQSRGFAGPLYPVNPNYAAVGGGRCYADIGALPETPDCVAIAVPWTAVFEPLEAAAARGVKAAVVVAEGFADAATAAGRARQQRLIDIARAHGMAVSGPNCMGNLGLKARLGTAFTNLPAGVVEGGVSVVSQSGGLLNAVIELGHNRAIGFNYLISAGNEAVVDAADYIDWLAADDGTRVIVNIVEGVRDGARYRAAVERAARRKPVVVLKLGRTKAGSRAATAHTGSLAGEAACFDALLDGSGATQVGTIDQLVETAILLDRAPLPKGERVFVFSVSGGATVLSGDLAERAGLNLPPLARRTGRVLGKILGVERDFHNPMDVVGAPRLVKDDNLTRCLGTLDADPAIDAVALVMVMQRETSASHKVLLDQFRAVQPGLAKPFVLISEMAWHPHVRPAPGDVPIAGTLADGMAALKSLVDYAAFRRTKPRRDAPRAMKSAPPLGIAGQPPLDEAASAALLAKAGLPFAPYAVARTRAEALRHARKLGWPVALKVVSPDLPHKSDAGGVRLGLRNAAGVGAAFDALRREVRRRAPGARIDGVLVQKMVEGGIEMILGGRVDPQYGPMVLVGAGGTLTELLADTAMARAPLDPAGARRLIRRLRAARLLAGWRGTPAADEAALARAVVALSR